MRVLTSKFAGIFQRLVTMQSFLTIAVASADRLPRNQPPPSPDKPWAPPELPKYEGELAGQRFRAFENGSHISIDPRKVYNLAELIDIAEQSNPDTRVAWQRARQAAAAVGLSESAYYPFLVASAAAGYDRAFIPFPTLAVNEKKLLMNPSLNAVSITGGGSLVTEAQVYRGELSAKWLLLDFGERSAVVASAKEQLMMANVGFNGTHQKIVFQVTERFYQLGTARQKVLVSQSALEAAQTVEQAVQARIDNGHATKTELDVSINHSDYFGDHRPTLGVFLTASVPIFDGFARDRQMEMAKAELRAAENELAGARDGAAREVWKADTDFKTALRKQESAAKLVTASQNAFDAVLESYKQGLSTYPEIISAQRNLASARSVSHDTQSAIFTAATALALSTGDLARPSARPLRPSAVRPLQSSPRGVRPLER